MSGIKMERKAVLAPMAGFGDRAFRELCKGCGAAMLTTEMVSAKGLCYNSEKTAGLMEFSEYERPVAIQLFGPDAESMSTAVKLASELKPDCIDINMGCPTPKIVNNGAGCAIMKNPSLAGEIVAAAAGASNIPVTVKIRSGWDEKSKNAPEIAAACEKNGAAGITVHARTREQFYAPGADWSMIKAVKEAVKIPVTGNGDITSADDAARMIEETGCDAVMIGRAALGAPWIFLQINSFLNGGRELPEPTLEEKLDYLYRQACAACAYKGEYRAMREMRAHASYYFKGIKGKAAFRKQAGMISTLDELEKLIAFVIEKKYE